MWFSKLAGKNVGPFADFDHDLTRGSIGVFGKNGRGKSTLLSLMYAVPTNDFGRFSGNKEECIRNVAGPKEESFVRGVIEHNGHTLDITRNLRVTKARPGTVLIVDGGQPIIDANKAQAEIDRLLGVDRKLLDLYAFKAQDKIYDFLSTTPAARAKAYQTLCRTEVCEEVWTMLGDFLNKDREINVEVVDNSDELAGQIASYKGELSGIDAQISQHQAHLLNDTSLNSANRIVKRADRASDLSGQADREEVREGQLLAVSAKADGEMEKLEERNEAAVALVSETSKPADSARAALLTLESYKQFRRQRKRLKDEAEALKAEVLALTPPEPPADLDKADQIARESVQLENDIDAAKRALKTLGTTGLAECPTCSTPVAHLSDHIGKLKGLAKNGPANLAKLNDRVAAIDAYKRSLKHFETVQASLKTRCAANAKSLSDLQEIQAVDADEAELRAAIAAHDTAKRDAGIALSQVTAARRAADKATADYTACHRRLQEIREELILSTDTDDKIERARQRLEEHHAAKAVIARLEGQAEGLRRQVAEKEKEITAVKTRLKRSKRVRRVAGTIARVRDAFHRDRLARRVAQTNLSRMEEDVNAGLALFGDPYWVESSADLTFTAHKPGEPPQPATFLSTGQRVILALSFWPAVASLWESDIGMLALDEPTANLDEDNRKLLAQALGGMTAKVRGRRQLIMVTHDPNLRSAFDQVLDLG